MGVARQPCRKAARLFALAFRWTTKGVQVTGTSLVDEMKVAISTRIAHGNMATRAHGEKLNVTPREEFLNVYLFRES
jgi:hypothetical protein